MERAPAHRPFLEAYKGLIQWASGCELTFTLNLACLVGLLGGCVAIGFRLLIAAMQTLAWGAAPVPASLVRASAGLRVLLLPVVGCLVVWAVARWIAPEVRGPGVAEVVHATAGKGGFIRLRVGLAKALAAAANIATGGSLGREGPIVQIGSALGSLVGQATYAPQRRMRVLVGCGAAAGIAATFNTPLAGALFAVEVILAEFAVGQFSPIVVSAVAATVVSRHVLGSTPAFPVPPYQLVAFWELFVYALVGVAAGALSAGFAALLARTEDLFDHLPLHGADRAVLGGLAIGVMGLYAPQVLGIGYDGIQAALAGEFLLGVLLFLLVAKMVATAVTLGAGGSGGLFAPTLFMGAMLGATAGTLVNWGYAGSVGSVGAYALVGMGAMVAATKRAPLTAIVMLFEMTNAYTIILPLLLAAIVAHTVSSGLRPLSINEERLRRRGVKLSEGRDLNVLRGLTVAQVMGSKAPAVGPDAPMPVLLDALAESHHDCLLVEDEAGRLLGQVHLEELHRRVLEGPGEEGEIFARDLMSPNHVTIAADQGLDRALPVFSTTGYDEIPVTDPRRPERVVGNLRQADLLEAYEQRIFHQDMARDFAAKIVAARRDDRVSVASGYSLVRRCPPTAWIDRSLAELDLPQRRHFKVVLVEKPQRETHREGEGDFFVPRGSYRVRRGDRLLLFGADADLERLDEGSLTRDDDRG